MHGNARRRDHWPAVAGSRAGGFTVLEVLVVIAIITILVTAVFPRVQRWIDQADATRSAVDLASIRTAIQVFEVNVRREPGLLTQLTRPITATDLDLEGVPYGSATGRWKGPYLDRILPDVGIADPVFELSSGGSVANEIVCFDLETAEYGCGPDTVIAVLVDNVLGSDFELINDVIDGDDEPTGTAVGQSRSTGKLQYVGEGVSHSLTIGTLIYLITPFAD